MTIRAHEPMPGMSDYRTSINELRFSDEAKAHMTARLANAATKEQPDVIISHHSSRRKRLPLAAAVAALALILCMGGIAFATGSFVSVERFVNHLFGGSETKVEVVDKIGRPVGVAQSINGVTVSADAIIGDKSSVAVVFSVFRDDGTPFEGIEASENGRLPLGFSEDLDVDFPLVTKIAQGMGATGSSYFYDADPTDNAIQLVEARTYADLGGTSLVGCTMSAHFEDLKLYGEGEPVVIAAGRWNLSFPLDYEDSSVELPTGQTFELAAFHEDDATGTKTELAPIQATIDELSISPIALHMRYTADHKVEWTSGESGRQSRHDSQLSDALLGVRVVVNLTDGTAIEAESYGSGTISADDDTARCETGIFFNQIIDPDEVSSVTIGDTTIEL